MDKLIDETSNKYGTYTVLEHIIGTKPTLWMCKCDCGNIIKCSGYDVRNKLSKRRCSKCDPVRVPEAPSDATEGSFFTMNDGASVVVLKYNTGNNIIVKFCDGKTKDFVASIGNLRCGKYKNPYSISVGTSGYLGDGNFSSKNNKFVYNIWNGILDRSDDNGIKRDAHKNVSVCSGWLCFQDFARWYYSKVGSNLCWEVDKDLLMFNNSHYSPDTCTLIPREINQKLPKRDRNHCYLRPSGVWAGNYRDKDGNRHTVTGKESLHVAAECISSTYKSIVAIVEKNNYLLEDVAIKRMHDMSSYSFVCGELKNVRQ